MLTNEQVAVLIARFQSLTEEEKRQLEEWGNSNLDDYVDESAEAQRNREEAELKAMQSGTSFSWSKDVYRDSEGRLRRRRRIAPPN